MLSRRAEERNSRVAGSNIKTGVCPANSQESIPGIILSMATIHISEDDAARDFPGLLARVRAGAEVVIENGANPVAVIRTAAPPRRSISESIALAEARSKDLGYKPVMDAGFAADLEEIIRSRKPRDTSVWE
jgi:antitoxin (DNA-binding transcriptional repressor) of toxin-antitoxin stability system